MALAEAIIPVVAAPVDMAADFDNEEKYVLSLKKVEEHYKEQGRRNRLPCFVIKVCTHKICKSS